MGLLFASLLSRDPKGQGSAVERHCDVTGLLLLWGSPAVVSPSPQLLVSLDQTLCCPFWKVLCHVRSEFSLQSV